jgi:hypothetical protein
MKGYLKGVIAVALFMLFMGVMLIYSKLGDREFAENELPGWVDAVATISDVTITREYGPELGFNKSRSDMDAYEYELYYTYQIEFETPEGHERSFSVDDSYEGSGNDREIPESAYNDVYGFEGEHEIIYNPDNVEEFEFGTSGEMQESAEDDEDIIVGAVIIIAAVIVIVICVIKTVKEKKNTQTQ